MADATADIKIIVKDVAGISRNLDRIEKKIAAMGNASKRASNQMVAANRQAAASFERMERSISKFTHGLAVIGTAVFAVKTLVDEIAKVQKVRLQLDAVSTSSEDFAKNLELVREISLTTGTSFEKNATVLARYTRALERYGGTAEHAAVVIDTLNKAFLLNGTTGSEATSVLVQLSQALTAGALSGDEFRSFAENAGSLVDGLAQTMGVTVQELKKLGAQGKITADILVKTAIRLNEEYTKLFEETGELPIDRALQNVVTEFEFAITKSEKLQGVFSALGGAIISLLEPLFSLVQFFEAIPFENVGTKVEGTASSFAILGDAIRAVVVIAVGFFKMFVSGLQVIGSTVTFALNSIATRFAALAATVQSVGEVVVDVFKAMASGGKTELPSTAFERFVKRQESITSDLKANVEEIRDVFDNQLGEIGQDAQNALFSSISDLSGENSGKLKGSILESLRNALSELKSPEAAQEADAAGKKLGEDFAKAFGSALTDTKDLQAKLNLLSSGGDERSLKALEDELEIQKELAKLKGASPEQLKALEGVLKLRYSLVQTLDDELERKRELQEIDAEMAKTTEDLLRVQFETANFTLEKTQEQLDYEMQLYDIRQKAAKLALVDPKAAAAFEKLNIDLLNAKTGLELFTEAQKANQAAWENFATMGANALASVISGTEEATDALRDLLKQLLLVAAQAAILKALGMQGGFGNIFTSLLGGGSGVIGGASAGPTVRVYNYGNQAGGVQTRPRSDGSVDVVIGQLASALAVGGNALDSTLRRTYGIRRQGN